MFTLLVYKKLLFNLLTQILHENEDSIDQLL